MDHNLNQSKDVSLDTSIGTKGENIMLKSSHNDSFFLDIEKDVNITNKDLERRLSEKRKIGHLYTFFYKDGEPRIVIGPHWPFYLCLITFINGICLTYFYYLWNYLGDLVKFLQIVVYLTQISSYTYTVLINPGIIRRETSIKIFESAEYKTNSKDYRICNACQVVFNKNDNTEHCDDCGVCIEGYDHHCPWTTKCIGKGNLKSFYIFVSFTFVLMGFLIFGIALLPHN